MRYLHMILCVFVLAALLAGCKVQGETKDIQNDSNDADELQEPSVIIPDSPVDGAANNDYWTEYSRAKTVDVLVDGALLYRLQLIDTIEYQLFSLPFPIVFKYYIPFDIRFEIIDVYPGKNATVAISDITLEPLIYH